MLVSFGGVSRLRAIEPMVDALALLPAELNVRLVVSGRCDSDELMNRLRKSPGFSRFEYQGWLPHAAMRSLLKRASIAMNLFSNAPINRRVRSNRFFESMAYGIPVLTANFPYWREIVERIGCGLTVDPEDPRDIARAVTFLLTHPAEAHAMGQRGRQAVVEQMNWETECGKLFQLYDRLLAERRR
jgi:glycosyltransferase involved in cell wall biosynthesis